MAKHAGIIAIEAADVQITAAEIEADGQPKGPPKFDVVAYTGGAMMVAGFDLPVVVDLNGMKFGRSLVANLDHESSKRVGHVTAKNKADGQLRLSGVVSAATPSAKEVVDSASQGFVWQASIEAKPDKIVELADGQSATVNGQEIVGPAYLVKASTLKGFAFVSHGADDATSATIAAIAAPQMEERKMDPKVKEFVATIGLDADKMSEEQIKQVTANFYGKTVEAKAPVASAPDAEAVELKRVEEIAEIVAQEREKGQLSEDKISEISAQALSQGWSTAKTRMEFIKAGIATQKTPHAPKERSAVNEQVIEAAICMVGKLPNIEAKFKPEILEAAEKEFRNGIGMKQLIRMGAEANGHKVGSGEITLETQRAAFGQLPSREIRASGGFSTISLPNILASTANKFLYQGFNSVDSTWRRVSTQRAVRDFKSTTLYGITGDMQYKQVGPAGEIKHGTVSETGYTNQANTYGLMLQVTRNMIINDDLDALSGIPARLGRGAALALNDKFWTVFLNNSDFFKSGNNNVSTGGGSALGTADGAAINAAEVKFMNQTDPDSKPLGIMPAIMLVPPTLRNTATRWMGSQLIITGSDTAQGATNVYQGRYRVESSPYMENSAYTGYSTAAWYLLANPADLSAIEVVFLNGRDTPTVETAEADFNVLGIQMRGVLDFGVALQEYRAGVRSAGS